MTLPAILLDRRGRWCVIGAAIALAIATACFSDPAHAGRTAPASSGGQADAISKCALFGVHNGTVICPPIHRTPKPTLQFVSVAESDNPDGTHTVNASAEVVAPAPQAQVSLLVLANNLMDVRVLANGAGSAALSQPALAPGAWQAALAKPSGRYSIVVTTKAKTPVRFGFSFQ